MGKFKTETARTSPYARFIQNAYPSSDSEDDDSSEDEAFDFDNCKESEHCYWVDTGKYQDQYQAFKEQFLNGQSETTRLGKLFRDANYAYRRLNNDGDPLKVTLANYLDLDLPRKELNFWDQCVEETNLEDHTDPNYLVNFEIFMDKIILYIESEMKQEN